MPATLLILGATGETGKQCLAAALASPSVTGVVSVGRRAPPVDTASPGYSKLQHQNVDFDKLLENDAAESQKLQEIQADAIVCALGAGSASREACQGLRAALIHSVIIQERRRLLPEAWTSLFALTVITS